MEVGEESISRAREMILREAKQVGKLTRRIGAHVAGGRPIAHRNSLFHPRRVSAPCKVSSHDTLRRREKGNEKWMRRDNRCIVTVILTRQLRPIVHRILEENL